MLTREESGRQSDPRDSEDYGFETQTRAKAIGRRDRIRGTNFKEASNAF
jgi:hypothetical protein